MPRKANPDRPAYAAEIAEARKRLSLSQQKFGQLIGRDTESVKKYEGGKVLPPFFVLMRIADVLSLDRMALAELVLKSDDADKWLDAAFEEITWVFPLLKTNIETDYNSEQVLISSSHHKLPFNKLRFLFTISQILQDAHKRYVDIVASDTESFVNNLLIDNTDYGNFN